MLGFRQDKGRKPDYIKNWLYYLVRFDAAQFALWKRIANGRMSATVLAEAVDVVMRGLAEEQNLR